MAAFPTQPVSQVLGRDDLPSRGTHEAPYWHDTTPDGCIARKKSNLSARRAVSGVNPGRTLAVEARVRLRGETPRLCNLLAAASDSESRRAGGGVVKVVMQR